MTPRPALRLIASPAKPPETQQEALRRHIRAVGLMLDLVAEELTRAQALMAAMQHGDKCLPGR